MKNDISIKANKYVWFDYVAVAIIVFVFFVISYCGFYASDDLSMAYGGSTKGYGEKVGEISSIIDVFKLTWWWYFHLGGRLFSVASQYFFCGLLGNRIWFDIVNTLFFMVLIIICGRLINTGINNKVRCVLVFALLFWLLCPKPNETLFWIAGSTTHMWSNTLVFMFLYLFLKYKDDNFNALGKIGLFFLSVFAATEIIPCVSICGAFVVYYAFHIKRFNGNAASFVVGFAIGSLLLLFAPGNFGRVKLEGGMSFFDKIQFLANHPLLELSKYKALWMFLIILACGWIKNKETVKSWMRVNSVLLLSLGWSIIAFSVVFRPENRALFFPETLSLVLFLRFLFDNYQIFEIRILDEIMSDNRSFVRSAIIIVLFVVFMMDSAHAIAETRKQCNNNDKSLKEIKDSGGIVALDRMISSHRMSYVPFFPVYTWEPLADRFGLDSVHVYPFFCQDKFYNQGLPWDNMYIDKVKDDYDLFGKYFNVIMRIRDEELQAPGNLVVFTIDYTRPRKWYKSWLDNWRNYQYDRTLVVEREKPDVRFNGYCYYGFRFKRENLKNLKSIKYAVE